MVLSQMLCIYMTDRQYDGPCMGAWVAIAACLQDHCQPSPGLQVALGHTRILEWSWGGGHSSYKLWSLPPNFCGVSRPTDSKAVWAAFAPWLVWCGVNSAMGSHVAGGGCMAHIWVGHHCVITSTFEQDTKAGISFVTACCMLLHTKYLHKNIGLWTGEHYGNAYGPCPAFSPLLWKPGGSSYLLILSCLDPC